MNAEEFLDEVRAMRLRFPDFELRRHSFGGATCGCMLTLFLVGRGIDAQEKSAIRLAKEHGVAYPWAVADGFDGRLTTVDAGLDYGPWFVAGRTFAAEVFGTKGEP